MSVIAFIYHWPATEMDCLELDDLARWQERAIAIYKSANTPRDQ